MKGDDLDTDVNEKIMNGNCLEEGQQRGEKHVFSDMKFNEV